jgi:UDP-3-O-[3-hydroxymyristoyl] N-acetylglucosamine deacetylase
MRRRTIQSPIRIGGIGLHRGEYITLTIKPSKEGGIMFVKGGTKIPASPEYVIDTTLNTTLGYKDVRISTIEHLMSAFYGLGITDCEVEIDSDELPSLDGSALFFVRQLESSGIKELDQEVCPIVIDSPIIVGNPQSGIEIYPGPFCIRYRIEFPEAIIGSQEFVFTGNNYIEDIAPARTFGKLEDVEKMRSLGLAMGGGLHNAVLLNGEDLINPEGLRYKDEFVRHKVLDILGDLWTLGAPVQGEIRAYKANHRLHIELAKKIKESKQ